jgi:hypothetical protein
VEKAARAAVDRLGAPASLARTHVHGDVDVLAHPEGEATHQRPRLSAAEVSPGRAIVALAEHLRAQPAAGGNADRVRPQVEIRPTGRGSRRPATQQAVPERAQRMHHSQQL